MCHEIGIYGVHTYNNRLTAKLLPRCACILLDNADSTIGLDVAT